MTKFLWIFDIDAVLVLPVITAALWSLGGSGPKLLRRVGVGLIIGLSALSLGCAWWLCLLQVGSLFLVTILPYGDKIHNKIGVFYWPFLFIIGALFGASLLPLAFFHSRWLYYGLGCALSSISFGVLTLSSQKLKFPVWKVCEITTGLVLGLCAVWLIS